MKGWIGVDLDGTLARYDGWKGEDHIGEPLQPMVDRVKAWLAQGQEIRIFTARASAWGRPTERLRKNIELIEAWCEKHIGQKLPVTSDKDYQCIGIWDDRAIQVAFNTGEPVYNPEPFKSGPLSSTDNKKPEILDMRLIDLQINGKPIHYFLDIERKYKKMLKEQA